MKTKKGHKLFFFILFVLFIIYVGLYIANISGYYEAKLKRNTYLTNEEIKRFEDDIKQGKNVSINNYISKKNYNYNNKISKAGLLFSSGVEKFMSDGIIEIFDVFKKLFT